MRLEKLEVALRLLENTRHNVTRGKIAEIVISKLTGSRMQAGYESFDLYLEGVRIQVKASGFLQSWSVKNGRLSKISFANLKKCEQIQPGRYSEPKFNADVYIFAVCKNKDMNIIDAELDTCLLYTSDAADE